MLENLLNQLDSVIDRKFLLIPKTTNYYVRIGCLCEREGFCNSVNCVNQNSGVVLSLLMGLNKSLIIPSVTYIINAKVSYYVVYLNQILIRKLDLI